MRAVPCLVVLVFAGLLAGGCPGGRPRPPAQFVRAWLTLPDVPDAIAVLPDGSRAYVIARGATHVVALPSAVRSGTIPLSPAPRAPALSPDGRRLYVGDFIGLRLVIVDTATNSVTDTVPLGRSSIPWEAAPSLLAVAPDGGTLYAGLPGSAELLAIETARPRDQRAAALTMRPGGVAVAPDGATVYVAGCPHGCLKGEFGAYDARTLARRAALDLPAPGSRTVVAPDGRLAYVLMRPANAVAVVDPRGPRLLATIPAGNLPGDMALAPDGTVLYVTSFGDGRLQVVDLGTRSPVGGAEVPTGPRGVAVSPDGRHVLVTAGVDQFLVFEAARLRRGG